MADAKDSTGKALRFLVSGGMADEDPDVVASLLTQAHRLADLVIADEQASPELRRAAAALLDQLASDAFSKY